MPRHRLTSIQAKAYMARWRAARAGQLQELRAASAEHKLRQVAALMASARALGWSPDSPEVAQARDGWERLRRAYDPRA